MLDTLLDIPGARYAVLVSADGLPLAYTRDLSRDVADTVCAAVSGWVSISKSLSVFLDGKHGGSPLEVDQNVADFGDNGWVFAIAAGTGAHLAVAASSDVDMGDITFRMQKLVAQLGPKLSARPREIST